MTNRRGFVSREAESFACAFRGIAALLRSEVHARIHLLATVVVIVLGWWFEITVGQWIAAVLAIGLVWVVSGAATSSSVSTTYPTSPGRTKCSRARAWAST